MTKASETRICFWRFFYCRGIRHERKGGISMDVMKAVESLQSDLWGVWFLIGAALVFWMQAGFAMVEGGFTRAKNAGNIIMKNLMDFCIGTVMFMLIGFSLLLGEDYLGFIGKPGIFQRLYLTLCSVQQRQQSFPEQWQRELSSYLIVYTQQ